LATISKSSIPFTCLILPEKTAISPVGAPEIGDNNGISIAGNVTKPVSAS